MTCQVKGELVAETDDAIGLKHDELEESVTWWPFSLIDKIERDGNHITLRVPEWIAMKKGVL